MLDMNALNAYQINVHQKMLYKARTVTAPSIILKEFSNVNHSYLRSSKSSSSFTTPKLTMKLTNFAISSRSPVLWNTALDTTLAEIESVLLFKANQLSFF